MSTPPENITVLCPKCEQLYKDWYRGSLNLNLDEFDEEYIREASTARCPKCGHVVELEQLIVAKDGTWKI